MIPANSILQNATHDDIPAIRVIEMRPENGGKIGSWSEAEHIGTMARGGVRYFVWREGARLRAFAIFERLDDVRGWSAYLRRIAVDAPGGGDGARFLTAALDWLYAETNTQKLELRCRVGNPAQRLYERLGFVVDGILANRPDDSESAVMSLLREDWLARRG